MNRKFLCIVLLAVSTMSPVSCATVGRDFDTTHVSDVETGSTDKAQVREWFGEPTQTVTLTDQATGGVERWVYSYAYSSWGGMSTTGKAFVVDFDENGTVVDHAYSQE